MTDRLQFCSAAMRELGSLERRKLGRWFNSRGGKWASPVPIKITSDAAISADEIAAGVRLDTRQRSQTLQFRPLPHQPTDLQIEPLNCIG